MTELRGLAEDIGWADVESYIQSGNLVFRAVGKPTKLETELEEAIAGRYVLSIPVVVRRSREWSGYLATNPFREASEIEPNLVMLALAKAAPNDGAVEQLRARATLGEQIRRVGNALWIHYAGGAGASKLSPALLDRAAGSVVTTRNWRTVTRLAAMADVAGD